jgi:hypothetical protein
MHAMAGMAGRTAPNDPCTGGTMVATSTNIHFHGLNIPPKCHQDEILMTDIENTDPPFQYRFQDSRERRAGHVLVSSAPARSGHAASERRGSRSVDHRRDRKVEAASGRPAGARVCGPAAVYESEFLDRRDRIN